MRMNSIAGLHRAVRQISPVVIGVATGVALGIGIFWSGSSIVVIAILGMLFLVAGIQHPEIGILGILALYSTVLSAGNDPHISAGPGNVYLSDLLLLSLFGLILVKALADPSFRLVRTPLDLPYIGFVGAGLAATGLAILRSSLTIRQSLGEVRIFAGYLGFFLVTNSIRNMRQVRNLLKGLLLMATVVAALMAAQTIFGVSTRLFAGRIETLATGREVYAGITRALPPGQSLILAGFIILSAIWAGEGRQSIHAIQFLQACILGFGVLLTYNRSFWLGAALALALMLILVGHTERKRIALGAIVVVLTGSLLLAPTLLEPESKIGHYFQAASDRFSTLLHPGTIQEESLQDRYREMQYALPQITPPPLLGIGLGAFYRPWDSRIDWLGQGPNTGFDGRGYIHNAHLWLLVKIGLLGYLCFLLLSGVAVARGLRLWNTLGDRTMQGVVLGVSLAYICVLVGSIVNPMLMQRYWTPVIGVILGLNEVIFRLNAPGSDSSPSGALPTGA